MAIALELRDYVALIGYFCLVIGFGVWSSCKNRGSLSGYFLAGRSMHFVPVGASLFASNIGSGHFIGLAGAGAATGIGTAGFELSAGFVLILLGWVFLPVYMRSGVYTMPEYMKKRFGGDRIRIYLSVLSLILYVFTKISADLFSGAIFIKESLDLNLYVSVIMLLAIAALFTIGGGLSAVIWTDFIQTIIMILGAFYLMIISFMEVGGFSSMKAKFSYAIANTTLFSNATCGLPTDEYFNLIRNVNSDYPWTGMLMGLAISSIWYWCSDQVIVQRVLSAKNMTHAKAGCILASYLKLLPLFMLVFPGMISRILYKDEVACADPLMCKMTCGGEGGCSNVAYPKMVIRLLPSGARGLMLAVMMAALMSSLTSIFNSSSTIFTMDIWKRLRSEASDWELMIVGRLFVVILVIISILWIPIIQASQGSRLFDYIQSITSYLAPPICAVYLMAIFVKRTNEPGAFWGLMIGLFVGLLRFIWQFSFTDPPCGKFNVSLMTPAIIKNVHYLHFGIILFIISCFAIFIISIMTKPIPDKHIKRLTYFTIHNDEEPVPILHKNQKYTLKTCLNGFDYDENENISISKNDFIKNGSHETINPKELKEKGTIVRSIYWLCGIESSLKQEEQQETQMDTSINEDPYWSRICNANALIAIIICSFFFAFFNKFN